MLQQHSTAVQQDPQAWLPWNYIDTLKKHDLPHFTEAKVASEVACVPALADLAAK